MKVVLLILAIVPIVALKDSGCSSSFTAFLNSLSTQATEYGRELDDEFDTDFVKQVAKCFDPYQTADSKKCVLSNDKLNANFYGDGGPLHGCDKCVEMATDIRNRIVDADSATKKCFFNKFALAVLNDVEPCIRSTLNDQTFNLPISILDLWYGGPSYEGSIKIIESGISHRVMAYSRLDECAARSLQRAQASQKCMDNYQGLFHKHCNISEKAAASSVTRDCRMIFDRTNNATCKCLDIKRDEWHDRLDKLKDAVLNFKGNITVCSAGIKAALGHWVQDFDYIQNACIPKDAARGKILNVPLSRLIDVTCNRLVGAVNYPDGVAKILIGFGMVENVFAAFNDRITIFCDINCLN
ncbi:hypothetical protein I4U23_021971 [Adineta vaga]|nr:hypothetical protein I4U23_021971 [Adineta vaga]